jgi:hypothetical protein
MAALLTAAVQPTPHQSPLVTASPPGEAFAPTVPVRVNNNFLSPSPYHKIFKNATAMYENLKSDHTSFASRKKEE